LKDFGAGFASRRHIQSVQSSSSCKVRESLSGIYEATGDYRGLQRMEKKKRERYKKQLKKTIALPEVANRPSLESNVSFIH